MDLEQTFINYGYTLNQAKAYLAALELGIGSAQDVGKKAGIKRTTAYSVLDELVRKGVAVKTKERRKDRYLVVSPRELAARYGEYQQRLVEAVPRLMAIHNQAAVKPKIQFFEGAEGIKQIYADTLREKPKEILEFNTSNIFDKFPGFPKQYVNKRRAQKIPARRIAPDTPDYRRHQGRDLAELSQTKLLKTEDYDIPIEINIYGNKVAFMSYGDELGLIIESESIARAMRQIYELFWKKI